MKRFLLFPLVLLLAACPGTSRAPVAVPKPAPPPASPPEKVEWQKSKSGLGFRLSDADPEPPPRPKLAPSKPLGAEDTARVLARLPRMKADPEEKTFALRDRSRPAPRPGETVTTAFPPPVAPLGPPPSPAGGAPPSLVRWAPEGAIEVAPHLSLTFSEPMVAVSSHGELAAGGVPARLNPQPQGKWRWIGTQTLLFEPKDERFPKATDYSVEVPAGIRTASGRVLEKAQSFGFKLPSVSVEQFHPPDYRTVELEPLLFARFDQRIVPRDVLGHITLTPKGKPLANAIALRLATADEIEADEAVRRLSQHSEPERFIVFRAALPLPKATRFTVTFKRSLPSAEGPKLAEKDRDFAFTTYGPLKLSNIDCGWSDGCAPLAGWSARFTNPLDASAFDESLVTIYPALPGLRLSISGETISIRGRSKGRTTYKVRFGQALKDKFGQTLESAAEDEVEVDAAEPMLFEEERSMVVLDPAFEPALSVYSVNRNTLKVRLYAVEPKDFRAYDKFRDDWDSEGKLTNPPGRLLATRTLSPKKAPDELVESQIELSSVLKDGTGQLIAIVEPPVQKPRKNRWDYQEREWVRTWIQVTKLGLMAFSDSTHFHGWVSRLSDGAPIANAEFGLLPATGAKGPVFARTGADGMAQLSRNTTDDFLVARAGSDLVFSPDRARPPYPRGDALRWFTFDDRSLYKPGERVHVKGWLRIATRGKKGDVARLPPGGHRIDFTVNDARGSKIAEGKTDVDSDGGFTLGFDLPKNANLGNAGVMLDLAGPASHLLYDRHSHQFQIQEFRRPEFEVTAEATTGPHFVGKHAIATVRATYYAGGSLPDSDVKWRVQADDAFFAPPNRRGFHFGKPRRFSFWRPDKDDQKRKADETWEARTHAGGQHRLRLDFDSLEPAYPRKLDLEATITDVNRQSWTARTDFVVHPANVTVGLRAESTLPTAGQNLQIDALVTDLEGKAVAGRSVSVNCARIESSWRGDQLIQSRRDETTCNLSSDGVDTAQRCAFATKEGGLHRLTAVVTDVHGRKSHTEVDVWVIGSDSGAQAGLKAGQVEVIADKTEYAGGDEAKLLVMAPFAPAEGVLTLDREGVVELRRFRLERRVQTIAARLDRSWLPGVHASVHLVGANLRENESGNPDPALPKRPAFAHGTAKLEIATSERALKVTLLPQSKALDPGASTTIALNVADAQGRALANASVALVVVDESVLALAGYELPDPLGVFYLARSPDVQSYETHDMVVLGKPDFSRMTLVAKKLKPKNGGGGRGEGIGLGSVGTVGYGAGSGRAGTVMRAMKASAAPMASAGPRLAEAPSEIRSDLTKAEKKSADVSGNADGEDKTPIAVRSNFSALAAFVPRLVTDARGQAQAKIKLPDSLTRYRVVAVAAANENQFGVGESDVTARLPLMVRPSPPRFLNFGDKAQVPVVLQNQTAEPINVDVALRVANLKLYDPHGQRVTVPAADRVELRFPVAARSAGSARLQLGASGRGQSGRSYADAAELELPVWTPATTEAFATYGVIDKGAVAQPVAMPRGVVTEFGALEITTSSTALQGLSDALLYLVRYPFECNEQLSSRVLSIAALRDVLTAFEAEGLPRPDALKRTIALDVQKLADRQHYSGGWDYWRRDREPDPYVSVHVTNALYRAKSKGYRVPDNTWNGALNFLRNIRQRFPPWWPPEARRAVEAYALNVRFRAGETDGAQARRLLAEAGGVAKLDIEPLGWLLPVLSKDAASAAELAAARRHLDNRVSETAGKAHFVSSYGDKAHLLLHSDRRTDGVLLDSLIDDRPQSDLIPKLVAGLLAHRKRGRWYNTQENVFILLGLDRYFQTFEKTTPDFVARAWLGDRFAAEHLFRGRSNNRKHVEVPLAAFAELVPPGKASNAVLSKEGTGRLYYRVGMQYALSDLRPPPAEHGFSVARVYEAVDAPNDVRRGPDGSWRVRSGALVRIRLTMVAPARRYHVALVNPLPAGFEPLNPALATTQSIPRDPDREPPLHQVEPGAVGRGEVQLEPGVGHQPLLDRGGLVGRGVVADHLHAQLARHRLVDVGKESLELDRPVAGGHLGDDVAGGQVQGGVQVGGAVAGVVVGLALGHARQQRQDRGGAVQCLHLGLFIHAQHHRRLGWVQVQANDVADLLDELGIGRQLEGVDQMRLEPKGPPDPADGRLRQADLAGQRSGRPVGRIGGRLLQGQDQHLLDLLIGDRAGRPQPGAHRPDPPSGGRQTASATWSPSASTPPAARRLRRCWRRRRSPARSDTATPAPGQSWPGGPSAPASPAPGRSAPAQPAWVHDGAAGYGLPCPCTNPTKPPTNQRLTTLGG